MPRPAWVEELKELPSNPDVTEALKVHEGEATRGQRPDLFTLVVTRVREVPPPIRLGLGVTVVDHGRFVETTLGDLEVYVSAKNRGSRHWAERLVEEKIANLAACGIEAGIMEVC